MKSPISKKGLPSAQAPSMFHCATAGRSLPAVTQWNLQSRRRAFPQHKRLLCSIYATISLHSSQRQRLQQTKAAQISQCHPNSWHQMAMISLPWLLKHKTFPVKTSSVPISQCHPSSWHQMAMISLPWLLKHKTFPVKTSSVPTSANRQCPSCSVKRHLKI